MFSNFQCTSYIAESDWKTYVDSNLLSVYRKMFRALSMTACDLSACAKPWKIQYETVKVIFQEFYAQVNGYTAESP